MLDVGEGGRCGRERRDAGRTDASSNTWNGRSRLSSLTQRDEDVKQNDDHDSGEL